MSLNPNQTKFIELAKKSEELSKQQAIVREELDAIMVSLNYDFVCQDPETLTVYKVVKPKGTFIYYKSIDYVRTAQEGERAGTLSKKESQELGFVLK